MYRAAKKPRPNLGLVLTTLTKPMDLFLGVSNCFLFSFIVVVLLGGRVEE